MENLRVNNGDGIYLDHSSSNSFANLIMNSHSSAIVIISSSLNNFTNLVVKDYAYDAIMAGFTSNRNIFTSWYTLTALVAAVIIFIQLL